MRELKHPNLITLKHAFFTTSETNIDEVYYNIVMDYMPETLYKLSRQYAKSKTKFPLLLGKALCYQMLRGLAHLHALGICHRDIKPQNVLVDPMSNKVKICDFGSAKKLMKGEKNIAYICSRFYRAPELILGAEYYNQQIDLWSLGTVIAELFLGEPIFPGESPTDQLVKIVKVLGTPTTEQLMQMNPNQKEMPKMPTIKAAPWSKVIDQVGQYS
jgi:glycogen synthase kinase 3 beta